MSIKRRGPLPAQRFTMIPNDWVRDERLSFRARGVLAYLMSHTEAWETSVAKLAASGTEGRDAIQTTIAELEALGYLIREQRHAGSGKFTGVDYILPMTDTIPSTVDGKPVNGLSGNGKSAAKKNISTEDHLERGARTPAASPPPVVEPPTPPTLPEPNSPRPFPEQCDSHQAGPHTDPCRACGTARESAKAAVVAAAAADRVGRDRLERHRHVDPPSVLADHPPAVTTAWHREINRRIRVGEAVTDRVAERVARNVLAGD